MAPSPHNTPLHESPSIASRDSEPGPVNASVKAATERTNVYSKPPLVMKKPCFKCALKAATIITPKIIAADKGVANPEARRERASQATALVELGDEHAQLQIRRFDLHAIEEQGTVSALHKDDTPGHNTVGTSRGPDTDHSFDGVTRPGYSRADDGRT